MKKIENFIDGNIQKGDSDEYLGVDDPSTGETISEVILSNTKDFEKTVSSSLKAYEGWSE